LLVVVLAGCGSQSGLTLGRVSGRVTDQGQPIRNGTVVFVPDESKGTVGPTGMGIIDRDGNFTLTTSDSGDGAIVGFHKIGITGLEDEPLPAAEAELPPPAPSQDALGYLKGKSARAQKARREVRPAAKSKVETFTDRGGRTFRYAIPKGLSSPEKSGIAVQVSRGSNTFHFDVKVDGSVSVQK
jgi:hypothetical protein